MTKPSATVIVPVKNSGSTIRQCVDSILSQDHQDTEVIVVGDEADSSWTALADVVDPRLRRISVQVAMNGATRDANLKRSIGLGLARGEVIVMTDSDMNFRPGWLSKGIALTSRYDVVASSMISTASGFLSRYVDSNRVGSRTPRFHNTYILNATNFGLRGFKPPVTANLFMRRSVYEATNGPDPSFTRSYEDYEWARRIVNAGFAIFSTDELAGFHSHRLRAREILRDYRRSGRGCADYIVTHPRCLLARARARQVAMITVGIFAGLLAVVSSPVLIAAAAVAVALCVMTLSWLRTRTLSALLYPWITLLLGLMFWGGLSTQLVRNRPRLALRRADLPLPAAFVLQDPVPVGWGLSQPSPYPHKPPSPPSGAPATGVLAAHAGVLTEGT